MTITQQPLPGSHGIVHNEHVSDLVGQIAASLFLVPEGDAQHFAQVVIAIGHLAVGEGVQREHDVDEYDGRAAWFFLEGAHFTADGNATAAATVFVVLVLVEAVRVGAGARAAGPYLYRMADKPHVVDL